MIKNGTKRIWCDSHHMTHTHHMTHIIQRSPYIGPAVSRRWRLPEFPDDRHMKVLKSVSAVHQGIHLVLNCVGSSVDQIAKVRPEVLFQ